ncbi:Ger(x)C family spore germination protein [Paenibacillus hodogayensis]|uniref:Ger(X)C family spore germination protein n=1 Tax=Paenibacillus hodogayensis TaxID=279208 RepID=A0ABV5W7L8_9BACL
MKRTIVWCALLLALAPLTGCWSRHELNELSIVVGLGIDKDGDKYKITAQIVNPGQVVVKKQAGSNVSPVITYEETGVTVPEALRRMTVKLPRRLYFAHMRMVVIGEDVARTGIGRPLDFISRDMEMRNDFYLVVAKKASASDVLKTFSSIDPIPANNMFTKLETSDELWAATGKMTLVELIDDLSTQGKSPTMTGVEIVGNRGDANRASSGQYIDPPVILTYSGMAAFKFDRMVGWLNENETKALKYIQNSVSQSIGYVSCPHGDGNISMEVARARSHIDVKVRGGVPVFDVSLRVEQNISDIECDADLMDVSIIAKLKEESDRKLKTMMEGAILKAQKQFGADIFGFGDVLHSKSPKTWHSIKDWNKVFENVEIRVHADTILRRTGTTLQPVQQQIER